MPRLRWKNDDGQVLVLLPAALIVVLAITGGVVDLGSAYVKQTKLQSAVDAAALAAAQATASGQNQGSTTVAEEVANQVVAKNGFSDVQFTASTGSNQIKTETANGWVVHLTSNVQSPTYFMRLFGRSDIPVSVSSTAQVQTTPSLQDTVYSKTTVTYSSGGSDSGNHGGVSFGGGKWGCGSKSDGFQPDNGTQENQPASTSLPHINVGFYESQAGQAIDQNTTISKDSYNSQWYSSSNSSVTVGNSGNANVLYVKGDVTINTGENLKCNAIVATGNITLDVNNISRPDGSSDQSPLPAIISTGGNITVDSNNLPSSYYYNNGYEPSYDSYGGWDTSTSGLNCLFYAPKGTVSVSGNNCIHGSIVANCVKFSQHDTHCVKYDKTVTEIPGSTQIRLVQWPVAQS